MRAESRGISLVEALVALAVMAFGLLGIVGMQSSLRQAADVSKQRAEAVRMAQEIIESGRAYASVSSGAGSFASIVSMPSTAASGPTSNTVFQIETTVVDFSGPKRKSLVVDVDWNDRTSSQQSIRLSTLIAGIPPAMAGATGFPGGHAGRHPAIPRSAPDLGNGTSGFDPPGLTPGGATPWRWIFDNETGFITQTCTGPLASPTCVSDRRRLLQGFVSFATGSTAPGPADAEQPGSPSQPVGVEVQQTFPPLHAPLTIICQTYQDTHAVEYWCAVPVDPTTTPEPAWSGHAVVVGPSWVGSIADASASKLRVCRYTPVRGCQPAVGDTIWGAPGTTASCSASAAPSRAMTNWDHPEHYDRAEESFVNQNFLVISAGDGTTAFDCPGDDTGTPSVNGNTWHHQPPS